MVLLVLTLVGCVEKGEDIESADPCAEASYDLTWANWGDGFFANYCRACHSASSPDRFGAPEGVNFDSSEDVRTWSSAIRRSVLVDEDMPVGGGVYETDLEFLDLFLTCGLD